MVLSGCPLEGISKEVDLGPFGGLLVDWRINKGVHRLTDWTKGTESWSSMKSAWNGLIWLPYRRIFERSRLEAYWRPIG